MNIGIKDNHLTVTGPVMFTNVTEITHAGLAVMNQPDPVVDLANVTELDSSAVSMLLAWLRVFQQQGQQQGHQLRLINLPQNLVSLIKLYDLAELLPLESR